MPHEIEDYLKRLSPRPPAIDRDKLLYQAGMAAGQRQWKTATLFATAVAVLCASVLAWRFSRHDSAATPEVPLLVTEPPYNASGATVELVQSPYRQLQEAILDRGLDGLPPLAPGPDPAGAMSMENLQREL